MADVLFVLIIVAFFGLASLLVRACDRILGPAEDVRETGRTEEAETEEIVA